MVNPPQTTRTNPTPSASAPTVRLGPSLGIGPYPGGYTPPNQGIIGGGGRKSYTPPSAPVAPPTSIPKTTISLPKEEVKPALSKEQVMTPGQKASAELKGFGTGIIAPLTFLAGLGQKSPAETGYDIIRGGSTAFAMMGVQTKKPAETFQIQRFGSGEAGFEIGLLTPSAILAYKASREPTIEIEVTKAQIKSTGMKDIPISVKEGQVITARGTGYEGLATTRIKSNYPLKGPQIQKIDSSFEYGLIGTGKKGYLLQESGIVKSMKEGNLYLATGRGTTETYIGKDLMTEKFLSREMAIKLPRETISIGQSTTGGGSKVYSIASGVKIAPREYGVIGTGFTPGSSTGFQVYQKVQIVSPKLAGEGFFGGIKTGTINIPVTSTSTAFAAPSSVSATIGGSILTRQIMGTKVFSLPYTPIGAPLFSMPKTAQKTELKMETKVSTVQIPKSTQDLGLKQISMQQSGLKSISSQSSTSLSRSIQSVSPIQIQPQPQMQIPKTMPITLQKTALPTVFPLYGLAALPPFSIYPGIRLGLGTSFGKTILGKQKFGYTPSLAASAFNIKSSRMPKFSMSGLVRRPIIGTRRKRRKK